MKHTYTHNRACNVYGHLQTKRARGPGLSDSMLEGSASSSRATLAREGSTLSLCHSCAILQDLSVPAGPRLLACGQHKRALLVGASCTSGRPSAPCKAAPIRSQSHRLCRRVTQRVPEDMVRKEGHRDGSVLAGLAHEHDVELALALRCATQVPQCPAQLLEPVVPCSKVRDACHDVRVFAAVIRIPSALRVRCRSHVQKQRRLFHGKHTGGGQVSEAADEQVPRHLRLVILGVLGERAPADARCARASTLFPMFE